MKAQNRPTFLGLAILACLGCGPGGNHGKLIDRWRDTQHAEFTWEFFADGRLTKASNTDVYRYRYTFQEPDRVRVTSDDGKTPVHDFTLSFENGDQVLYLTQQEPEPRTYQFTRQ